MNFWFLGIIAVYILSLGNSIGAHGRPRTGKINFWVQLIVVGIWTFIIYMAVKTGF